MSAAEATFDGEIKSVLVDAKRGAKLFDICERSYHDLRKDPDFPKPVRLKASRSVRWRVADLMRYIDALPQIETVAEPKQLKGTNKHPKQLRPSVAKS